MGKPYLVGSFNPSEKYARQNGWTSSPKFSGWKCSKIFETATTWLKCESWPGRIPEILSESFWYFPPTSQGTLTMRSGTVLPRGLWWSRKVTFLGGNGSIYFPYSHVPKQEKELENTEKQNRLFFETNTIFLLLWSNYQEWPRGTSRCCILPPWSLTARLPLKKYIPTRKGSSSNHHFSGAMLNFRGVRLYGMQPRTPASMPVAKGYYLSFWEGGSHP